jgi:hypothetical protein
MTNPDTTQPAELIGFYLVVSERVREHLDREGIARAFGRYLAGFWDEEVVLAHRIYSDGAHDSVWVRVATDDDGYSMTLAEEEEALR